MGAMGNGKDGESKENSALRSVWSTCACSSAVEHLVYTQRVGSSKLSARTIKIKGLSWFVKIVTLVELSLCRHREDIAALEDASEKPDFARLGRARGKSGVLWRGLAASDNRLPLNPKIGCDISAEGRQLMFGFAEP